MAFSDGADTEFMWLAPVRYDGKSFHGSVSNVPRTVKNVREGQPAVVLATEIGDWMYLEDGKVVGGHTLRVLRETLTPRERAQFDQEVKFLEE